MPTGLSLVAARAAAHVRKQRQQSSRVNVDGWQQNYGSFFIHRIAVAAALAADQSGLPCFASDGDRNVARQSTIESNQSNRASNRTRKPRPIVDGFGWLWGIPGKITLWDRRVENHSVSLATQQTMETYLSENGLDEIKVRINQYRPIDDWRRLRRTRVWRGLGDTRLGP